jgi:Do/DeqQ family serine protease
MLLAACAVSLATGLLAGVSLSPALPGRALAGPAPLPGPDFSAIARRATPAVVNISALQVYRTRRSPFFSDPFFREFFGRDSPFRVPLEERKTSLGSGVIIGSDGVIVTNNHVIEHARQIAITTADRRRLQARLVGTDPATDIAVVKVDARGLPTLSWGDSSRVQVGEYVVAIGNPFQLNQTVTMGIISATGRSNVGIVDYEDFIQTDAAINPGNSGGALVNLRGELVGINTAIIGPSGGNVGIGFAVPVNMARAVMEQLLAYGEVRRGRLGIAIQDLTPDLKDALQVPVGHGAVVTRVDPNSPAETAGLKSGDVIVAVDGRAIESSSALRNAVGVMPIGYTVVLIAYRGAEKLEFRAKISKGA